MSDEKGLTPEQEAEAKLFEALRQEAKRAQKKGALAEENKK